MLRNRTPVASFSPPFHSCYAFPSPCGDGAMLSGAMVEGRELSCGSWSALFRTPCGLSCFAIRALFPSGVCDEARIAKQDEQGRKLSRLRSKGTSNVNSQKNDRALKNKQQNINVQFFSGQVASPRVAEQGNGIVFYQCIDRGNL